MKLKMLAIAWVAIASLASAQTTLDQTGSGPTSTGERSLAAAPVGEISTVNEFTPGKSIKSPDQVRGHNRSFTFSHRTYGTWTRLEAHSIRATYSPAHACGSTCWVPDQV